MLVRKCNNHTEESLNNIWTDLLTVLDPDSLYFGCTGAKLIELSIRRVGDSTNVIGLVGRFDTAKIQLDYVVNDKGVNQLNRFVSRGANTPYENLLDRSYEVNIDYDITEIQFETEGK